MQYGSVPLLVTRHDLYKHIRIVTGLTLLQRGRS
jgi:hypothetical protein